MAHIPTTARGTALITAVILLAGLLVAAEPPAPAHALHQHCGAGLEGTGSRTNGHPNPDEPHTAWAGVGQVQALEDASQGIGAARTMLGNALGIIDKYADLLKALRDGAAENVVTAVGPALTVGTPASQVYAGTIYIPFNVSKGAMKYIGVALHVTDFVLIITELGVDAALFNVNGKVNGEDACGGTLSGDTMHMAWVAMVQRNLSMSGPPLAMLMTPHRPPVLQINPQQFPILPSMSKDHFPWCPSIPAAAMGQLPIPAVDSNTTTPDLALSNDGDCVSTVQQGFLDVPDFGVRDITAAVIDHMKSHGNMIHNAEDLYTQAEAKYMAHEYRAAFHLYRDAYQAATGIVTS